METYELVLGKAQAAKKAAAKLAVTGTAVKNAALLAMAAALEEARSWLPRRPQQLQAQSA